MVNIKQLDGWLDKTQFICTKTDGKTIYNFSHFTSPLKFASKIYNKDFTLKEAEDNQQELEILINKLSNKYNPLNKIKIKEKNDTLESAKKLFNIRKEIIRAFKRGIFPYIDGFKVDEELDKNRFFKDIENESKDINYKLFKDYFRSAAPTVLAKTLFEIKDKKKNNDLVNVIKSGLRDLKDEIEKMSEDEIEIEKSNKILDIVEKSLEFNEKIQSERGLKIPIPNQMLSRLPITLA